MLSLVNAELATNFTPNTISSVSDANRAVPSFSFFPLPFEDLDDNVGELDSPSG